MQVRTVTKDFLFSNECTLEMLTEIATHKDYLAQTQEWVSKLASQELRNGSAKKGSKSHASGDMPYAKLRTVIVQKLQDSPEQGEVFKAGNMQFEFACLQDVPPEPDINAAGKNKAKRQASSGTATELKGAYVVVKKGLKCDEATDPGKWAIWQHVWGCGSFEEFFQKAPKKGVTKTGRVVSATSEIRWALKSGWIKPASNDAEQQQ